MPKTVAKTVPQQPLLEAVEQQWPTEAWHNVHVLVAISGGADSTCLLRVLSDLNHAKTGRDRIFAAHVNHGMRGAASDADAAWVAQLCAQLNIPLQVAQTEQPLRSEAEARTARYQLLGRMAGDVGARYIATGHTRDDQVETILHRVMRGSGLAGLSGMPATRPLNSAVTIVRPLLGCSRKEIEEFLRELGQDYRTDSSNADSRFTRNWIRNELLPLMNDRTDGFAPEALLRLAHQAAEAQSVIAHLAAEFSSERIEVRGNQILIAECGNTLTEPPLVIREAIKLAWRAAGWPEQAMTSQHWGQIHSLLTDPASTAINLPGGVRAELIEGDAVLSQLIDDA